MKIAIEAQRIFRKKKHGMDFVALETIRALQKIDFTNEYFILVKPGEDHCLEETANFHIVEVKGSTYFLWEQIALPIALSRIKPDILHCTENTAPLYCPFPIVLTLHDIIYLEKQAEGNPSLYQRFGRIYRQWIVPRIVPHCRMIITVSDYERKNILNKLPLKPENVRTVYNGLSPVFNREKRNVKIVKRYIPNDSYLLFFGNTDPKKNTATTLKAYQLYLEQSLHKRPLLIADLEESQIDEILARENLSGIKSSLYFPGYIPNADLPYIYTGAFLFLYPSLRESFGLPILEAMASGVPVITSRTSAIPEIAGEKAILVDPRSPNEIVDAIIKLEKDTVHYKEQVLYGMDRIRTFSWETTAHHLTKIYNRINKTKC